MKILRGIYRWFFPPDRTGWYPTDKPYIATVWYVVGDESRKYEREFTEDYLYDRLGGIWWTAEHYALAFAERTKTSGLDFDVLGMTMMYPAYQIREITVAEVQQERQVES